MAVIHNCGFECRVSLAAAAATPDERHWFAVGGAAPTISTTTVHSGTAALRNNVAATAQNLNFTIPAGKRTIAGRFYVRIATLPDVQVHIYNLANASGNGVFRVGTNGQCQILCGASAAVNVGSPLSTGVWYRVDILFDASGATASVKARIDGGTEASATNSQAAADITTLRFGTFQSVTTDLFLDDLILGDASGDYPFGAGVTERLKPNVDGTHSFTAGDFGYNTAGADVATSATDVNTYVDDDDLTSTADLIRQKVVRTAGYVEVGFEDAPASGTPQAVNVVTSWHAAGTNADTMGAKLNDGGTIKTITDEAGDGLTDVSQTGIILLEKVLTVAPSDSNPWTKAKLDAVKLRAGYSDDINPVPYWDGAMLEVSYPAVVVAGASPTALTITTYAPTIAHQINGASPTALALSTFAPTVTVAAAAITVTPGTASLTLTTFAPVLQLSVIPSTAALSTASFAPVLQLQVIPGTTALTLTTFAPPIGRGVVPTTAALTLTTFAPRLDYVIVIDGPGPESPSLTLAGFAPAIGKGVVPSTTALTLTTFAPTVLAPRTVTPDVAALTTSTFAPVLSSEISVPAVALSLTTFAPTLAITDYQVVTPDPAALTVTTFAPTLALTVTPATASLSLTTFAPTVTATAHQVATPGTASLSLTTFAPTVTAANDVVVTPDTASLTLSPFAPTVMLPVAVVPGVAALTLSRFAPTVSAPRTVTPSTAALSLAAFAPALQLGVIPDPASLSLGTFAPIIELSDNIVVTPTVAGLAITPFEPTVYGVLVPDTAALILTTYPPRARATAPLGGTIVVVDRNAGGEIAAAAAPGGAITNGTAPGGSITRTGIGGGISRSSGIGGNVEVERPT